VFKWLRVRRCLRMLSSPQYSRQQRVDAVRALGESGGAHAVERLLDLVLPYEPEFGESRRGEVCAAAQALGKLGDLRAVKPLIETLAAVNCLEGWPYVAAEAAKALGRLGSPRAIEPLIKALHSHHGFVRSAVARALGRLGEPVWQQLVRGDDGDFARLGESGDARAVEPLTHVLGYKESIAGCEIRRDPAERRGAAEALGKLGDARAIEPLVEALGHPEADVGCAAVDALVGLCADTRAIEPVIKALGRWGWYCRLCAVEVLGKLGDLRTVEPLVHALGDGGTEVRRAAALALGKLGDARAVEPLIKALGDAEGSVRRVAAEALAALGQPVWQELVTGEAEDIARLGASGGPRAVEALIKALGCCHEDARRAAAEALGKLGDPRAVEPLIKALGYCHPGVQSAAADALASLGDARAVEPLIKALGDAEGNVRRVAAAALAALGQPAWQELVRGEAEDIARVGASGSPGAFEPLINALRGGDAHARRAAAEALGRLGDRRAIKPLTQAAIWGRDPGCRRAATDALLAISPRLRQLVDAATRRHEHRNKH